MSYTMPRLWITLAFAAVIANAFVEASLEKASPDLLETAEKQTQCIAYCLSNKTDCTDELSPTPLQSRFSQCTNFCTEACKENNKTTSSGDICGLICNFATTPTIWREMSDNSLRLDDDSILRWDPPWGNGSQDIVYLPFVAKAGSSKWKPLEAKLETTVDIRRLELECYEFRVDAYGKNGTQYTKVKYSKPYRKDLCENIINQGSTTSPCADHDSLDHSHLVFTLPIIFSSFLFVVLVILIAIYRERRHSAKDLHRHLKSIAFSPPDLEPPVFDFVDAPDAWEIKPNEMTLLDVIGEGFFGVVLKAEISRMRSLSTSRRNMSLDDHRLLSRRRSSERKIKTIVACKMLKENGTREHLVDLMEEIQLMKRIGKHKHIVSMLGCITRCHPVCIVVEYCPHGDLLSYLKRGRPRFYRRPSADDVMKDDYVPMHEPSHVYTNVARKDSVQLVIDEDQTEFSAFDLLSFAWQIASGMEYLTGKGLVHRDLASRNVLVLEDKLVKVSDFGLTRAVHNDGIYPQKTTRRLPFRWMSIEAISDRHFTEQSDVWSFGVVMWEICTLGSFPYPSISSKDLLSHIRNGNRLSCPENCSDQLYEMMCQCWLADPEKRPSFRRLLLKLEEMLEHEGPAKHLNVNFSYSYSLWNLEDIRESPEIVEDIASTASVQNLTTGRPSIIVKKLLSSPV